MWFSFFIHKNRDSHIFIAYWHWLLCCDCAWVYIFILKMVRKGAAAVKHTIRCTLIESIQRYTVVYLHKKRILIWKFSEQNFVYLLIYFARLIICMWINMLFIAEWVKTKNCNRYSICVCAYTIFCVSSFVLNHKRNR